MAREITKKDFDSAVKQATKPVVLDFYAEWCGPCQQMAPLFEELSTELADQYHLYKVNIDEEKELAIEHSISSIPTLVFYKNGTVVGVESGFLDKNEIQSKLAEHFGS